MILIRPEEMTSYGEYGAEVRHRLHQNAEIGLNLTATEEILLSELEKMEGVEVFTRVGGKDVTGIVAVIKGNRPGRTIAFRADSDALPLYENTGKPWTSKNEKRMHACGHDGHTATLLTAVKYLSEHRDFAGTFVAVFQPGEEGFAGGRHMVEDGLVERFGIEEFYALHAEPTVPVGSIATIPGYATANADVFEVIFKGKGGHGSRPHFCKDPIVAASEFVLAVQTVASRNTDPTQTAVVSVCSFMSGDPTGSSVVPQMARLTGTTRSFEPEVEDIIEKRMKEIAEGVAAVHDMDVEFNYKRLYPAMYNNPELVEEGNKILKTLLGEEKVGQFIRRAGGEDFSFMLRAKPGFLFRLGMKDEDHQAPVHNECFDFNDKAIPTGAAAIVTLTLNRMKA